jgi:hypothetical protein
MGLKPSEAVATSWHKFPPSPRDPVFPPAAARAGVATNNGTSAHFSDRVEKDIAWRA